MDLQLAAQSYEKARALQPSMARYDLRKIFSRSSPPVTKCVLHRYPQLRKVLGLTDAFDPQLQNPSGTSTVE
jgi:hypothetical protein